MGHDILMIIYHENRKRRSLGQESLLNAASFSLNYDISQILVKVAFNAITLPPILTMIIFLIYTHIVLIIA